MPSLSRRGLSPSNVALLWLVMSIIAGESFINPPVFSRPTVSNRGIDSHRHSSSSNDSNNEASSFNDPASELTSALARIDRQWKIQQRQKGSRVASRWQTLRLIDDNNDSQESSNDGTSRSTTQSPFDPASVFSAAQQQQPEEIVYLLQPPNQSVPSCLLIFVGGAGLGTYPHIAYNELLLRLSDRLNAAILATPYTVGLDHFGLARTTGEKARRAMVQCQEDPNILLPPSLPVYCLAHSLGAKLMTIHMAATNPDDYAGMGWISYNNFGFGQTIGMAKDFAEQIQSATIPNNDRNKSPFSNSNTKQILDQVFSFAETAISAIGIDFSPTAEQMRKLVTLKYKPEWQAKTRLFTFDNDTLQNTLEFCNCLQPQASGGRSPAVDVSELPGTHLTPVYFQFGLDELDIPDQDIRNMAQEAMGGFEKASFGDEDKLNQLVDEVCSWILGKDPSRRPPWQRERPQIAGVSLEEEDAS